MLRTFPGLWLQVHTVAAVVTPIILFDGVRRGMRRIVDVTPWHWFAYFQGLRIAALGTAGRPSESSLPTSSTGSAFPICCLAPRPDVPPQHRLAVFRDEHETVVAFVDGVGGSTVLARPALRTASLLTEWR